MDISSVLQTLINIFARVIPILMILATIVLLWGIGGYVAAGADEERRKSFKSFIVWGLVGLFAMVAVWGIVRAIVSSFGLGAPWWGPGTPPFPPDSPPGEFFRLLRKINFVVVSPLITLSFVVGTVVFLWGAIQFIWASRSGDEKQMEVGKKHIVWGIIALFVMVSLFAIVEAMRASFGFEGLPYFLPINP